MGPLLASFQKYILWSDLSLQAKYAGGLRLRVREVCCVYFTPLSHVRAARVWVSSHVLGLDAYGYAVPHVVGLPSPFRTRAMQS